MHCSSKMATRDRSPKTGTALEAGVVRNCSSTTFIAILECFCEFTSVPSSAEVRMFSDVCTRLWHETTVNVFFFIYSLSHMLRIEK